jgi:signal transduction histidine kinase
LPDLPQRGPPEVRATAEALKRLSIRLKAAMESRMRLVAAAGHDLRTPMTRMRLRAEFLQEGERDVWLSDLDELERIADSAIRLVREETEASAQELFALDRLVHDVIDELATLGFKIIAGSIDSAKVRGSPFGSARALRNLMINAATHGEGAVVSLTVSDFIAHVLIDDRGPGIPEQLLNHVFEPFFRVDQARRQSLPGAGLGLAIAKEIIDRQGGAIVVTNRSDGGLRQDVSFPPATANENHE